MKTKLADSRVRLAVFLLVLVAFVWILAARDAMRHDLRPSRWDASLVWDQDQAGDVWWMGLARDDRRGPALVVQRDTTVDVVGVDGKGIENGQVPWGTQGTTGDFDGDGRDELVFVTELGNERPSVQVVSREINPVGQTVDLLDMGIPATVEAFDLDGDGASEIVVGDFNGCVTALRFPDFLWDDCPPGEKTSGDEAAARLLDAMPVGRERRLVVGRAMGGVRVPRGGGDTYWTYEVRDGLGSLRSADLDGDGNGEVVLGSKTGRLTVLDSAGQVKWEESIGDWVRTLELLDWDGVPATTEIAAGADDGTLEIFDVDGDTLATFDVGGQIMRLHGADLDGDGRDELMVGSGDLHLRVLGAGGVRGLVRAVPTTVRQFVTTTALTGGNLLIAAAGPRVEALRITRRDAPAWYSPLAAGLAASLILAGIAFALLRFERRMPPPVPAPKRLRPRLLSKADLAKDEAR